MSDFVYSLQPPLLHAVKLCLNSYIQHCSTNAKKFQQLFYNILHFFTFLRNIFYVFRVILLCRLPPRIKCYQYYILREPYSIRTCKVLAALCTRYTSSSHVRSTSSTASHAFPRLTAHSIRQNCVAPTGCRLCAIVRHCVARAYLRYVRATKCGKSAQDTRRRLAVFDYCMAMQNRLMQVLTKLHKNTLLHVRIIS